MKQVELKNGTSMTVREAELDDAEGMVKLLDKVTYESDNITRGPGEWTFTAEQERDFIQKAKDQEGNAFFVGVIEDEIIAVSNIASSNRSRLKHVGEIGISVLKKVWGIGVGTEMMKYMVDWAKDEGLRKLNLSVRSDHEAGIHLYEKVGFRREGLRTRTMFIKGEFVDTVDMGLEID